MIVKRSFDQAAGKTALTQPFGGPWLTAGGASSIIIAVGIAAAFGSAPARASGDIGAQSTQTIAISISIAPRHALRAISRDHGGSGKAGLGTRMLCLETNSASSPDKVTILMPRIAGGDSMALASAPVAPLPRCHHSAGQRDSSPQLPDGLPKGRLVVVRPE